MAEFQQFDETDPYEAPPWIWKSATVQEDRYAIFLYCWQPEGKAN